MLLAAFLKLDFLTLKPVTERHRFDFVIGSLGVMICDPDSDGDILFSRAAIAKATGKE